MILLRNLVPMRGLLRALNRSGTTTLSRQSSTGKRLLGEKTGFYMASIAVGMFGASFAAVPLYRLYCQATGKGGQAFKEDENKIVNLNVDKSRTVTDKIKVHPGETALAFYRVRNPLDEMVIGVATYTVLPYEAGQYFNKIQCFCFEEQMLKPHEDIFMPVLFYIDPEFSKDPALANMSDVVLSYTFFRSKDGEILEVGEGDEPIVISSHKK